MPDTVRFVLRDMQASADLVPIAKALLQMPEVVVGLNGDLAKSIVPGSRTTGYLTGSGFKRMQSEGRQRAMEVQDDFRDRFNDHIQDWREAVNHHIAGQIIDIELQQKYSYILHRSRRDIRIAYRDLFEAGKRSAGNALQITPEENKALEKLRRDEFLYLRNFLQDIRHGIGVMDYERRAELYGNASGEALWAGFVAGDLSHNRWLRWRLNETAEDCPDCLRLASGGRWKNGIYSANELIRMGIFPTSGRLACTTNCKCRLIPARKRKWKNEQTDAEKRGLGMQPFKTLKEKPPIRPKLETQKKRYKWAWRGRVKRTH
ncbi:MAG: hypothetical protein COZ56_02125 [Armatimonadetes bacterium CG_4_8_14_3_um_filter_58_9]|nr:MAG: hypothetical protein COZ56_02125 [Armatimonadetes bacterium CG_4_8_14_3_um_filter_58_9]